MSGTLATSLCLLQPHLAPELITPEKVESLIQAAHWLPPIPRAGFECRLAAEAAQIDLHQNIRADNGEPAIVALHLARLIAANPAALDPAWFCVQHFCEEWAAPESLLHAGIEELWLELDLQAPQPVLQAPSVFIGVKPSIQSLVTRQSIFFRALELFSRKQLPEPVLHKLAKCFDAVPGAAEITHIGFMLSRQPDMVRVNVKGLQSKQLDQYLVKIGWPEGFAEVVTACKATIERVGDTTLCFDVASTVLPHIGVECFLESNPDKSRWNSWLDYLVGCGLCSEEKRFALLAWQGRTTPASAEREWPAHLIIDSLLQAPNSFSVFERLLHHAKLIHGPGGQVTVKGYFGFTHQWLETA